MHASQWAITHHQSSCVQEYTLKKFVPFNPVDKYTIAIVSDNKTGRAFRVMKGAPQVRMCCLIRKPPAGVDVPMRMSP